MGRAAQIFLKNLIWMGRNTWTQSFTEQMEHKKS